MSSHHPQDSGSLGSQLKTGLKGIHGVGEAIRGTVLSETDKALGTKDPAELAKNEAIAKKGVADAKHADEMIGREHGVKGSTATRQNPETETMTTTTNTTSTNTARQPGVHSMAPGNVVATGATGPGAHGDVGVQEQMGSNQRY